MARYARLYGRRSQCRPRPPPLLEPASEILVPLGARHRGGRVAVAICLQLRLAEAPPALVAVGEQPLAHAAVALERRLVQGRVAVTVEEGRIQPAAMQPAADRHRLCAG
eukprot:scaffold8_cov66-Phaeocystis_antarctica.AAC.1